MERYQQVSLVLQDLAEQVNDYLTAVTGEDIAFVIVLSVDKTAQFISNCERKDSQELLQSLLDRWKANRADIPAHYNPDLKGTL